MIKSIVYNGVSVPIQVEAREWRGLFTPSQLRQAEAALARGHVRNVEILDRQCSAWVGRSTIYRVDLVAPMSWEETWADMPLACTCRACVVSRKQSAQKWVHCTHMATALLYWEREHGPWEVQACSIEEAYAQLQEQQAQKAWEEQAHARYLEQTHPRLSVLSVLPTHPAPVSSWYHVERALQPLYTDAFQKACLPDLLSPDLALDPIEPLNPVERTAPDGTHTLQLTMTLYLPELDGPHGQAQTVHLGIQGGHVTDSHCSCYYAQSQDEGPLCAHQLYAWQCLWNYVDAHPLDLHTDERTRQFLDRCQQQLSVFSYIRPPQPRARHLTLRAQLLLRPGHWQVRCLLGTADGQELPVYRPREMLLAHAAGGSYPISRQQVIDFYREDFVSAAEPTLHWLLHHPTAQSSGYISLDVGLLDAFFALHCGSSITLLREDGTTERIAVTDQARPFPATLRSLPIEDASGAFMGIQIQGELPACMDGALARYCVQDGYLFRLSPVQTVAARCLQPDAAEPFTDYFFGIEDLDAFYQRVLPRLLAAPGLRFIDPCAQKAGRDLSPLPRFHFLLRLSGGHMLCHCTVQYPGRDEYVPLPVSKLREGLYHCDREAEVYQTLQAIFHHKQKKAAPDAEYWFYRDGTDPFLFDFFQLQLPRLEALGTIEGYPGTASLQLLSIQAPRLRISLQDAGQIAIQADLGFSALGIQDPLPILEAWQARQYYLRLPGGHFLCLHGESAEALQCLDTLSQALGVSLHALLQGLTLPRSSVYFMHEQLSRHAPNCQVDWEAALLGDIEAYAAQTRTSNSELAWLTANQTRSVLWSPVPCPDYLSTVARALRDLPPKRAAALVICHSYMLTAWRQAFQYAKLDPVMLTEDSLRHLQAGRLYLTTYSSLKRAYALYLHSAGFSLAVLDDCHTLLDRHGVTLPAVQQLPIEAFWYLTQADYTQDLDRILRLLPPKSLRQCAPYSFLDAHRAHLSSLLYPFLRAHKPVPPGRMLLPLTLDEATQAAYTRTKDALQRALDTHMRAEGGDAVPDAKELQLIRELFQALCGACEPSTPRLQATRDLLHTVHAAGHKVLLRTQQLPLVSYFNTLLTQDGLRPLVLTDTTPPDVRSAYLQDFASGRGCVLLLCQRSGLSWLSHTHIDCLIDYDGCWNFDPPYYMSRRVGQQALQAHCLYQLVYADTAEPALAQQQLGLPQCTLAQLRALF